MYETQLVRHTTMIVGPTGGGKTLVLETLKNSRLIAENIVVKMFVLNPKAQPLNELYGEMDPVTRDWTGDFHTILYSNCIVMFMYIFIFLLVFVLLSIFIFIFIFVLISIFIFIFIFIFVLISIFIFIFIFIFI